MEKYFKILQELKIDPLINSVQQLIVSSSGMDLVLLNLISENLKMQKGLLAQQAIFEQIADQLQNLEMRLQLIEEGFG